MSTNLKLTAYSLAAQSRILKKLARSQKEPKLQIAFTPYIQREAAAVRKEARSVHLARGFLRGRTLLDMELPYRPANEGHISSKGLTKTVPDWDRIEEILLDHGKKFYDTEQELLQRITEFFDGAIFGPIEYD